MILVNSLFEFDPFNGVADKNMIPADISVNELSGFVTYSRKTIGWFDLFWLFYAYLLTSEGGCVIIGAKRALANKKPHAGDCSGGVGGLD